jgi:YggT family protein
MIIFQILYSLLSVYSIILLISIILSWVRPDPYGPLREVVRIITLLTEPVLAPVRRLLPPMGGLDFSPIIVFFIIRFLQQLLLMR